MPCPKIASLSRHLSSAPRLSNAHASQLVLSTQSRPDYYVFFGRSLDSSPSCSHGSRALPPTCVHSPFNNVNLVPLDSSSISQLQPTLINVWGSTTAKLPSCINRRTSPPYPLMCGGYLYINIYPQFIVGIEDLSRLIGYVGIFTRMLSVYEPNDF